MLHATTWMNLTISMKIGEVQKQVNLLCQKSELWLLLGNREGFVIGKECERGFWSAGKGLFLDQGDGFMDMLTL